MRAHTSDVNDRCVCGHYAGSHIRTHGHCMAHVGGAVCTCIQYVNGQLMPMTPRDQLAAAIKTSGLSASAYARTVLIREPRTIRRWLAGDSPIPQSVIAFLNQEKV